MTRSRRGAPMSLSPSKLASRAPIAIIAYPLCLRHNNVHARGGIAVRPCHVGVRDRGPLSTRQAATRSCPVWTLCGPPCLRLASIHIDQALDSLTSLRAARNSPVFLPGMRSRRSTGPAIAVVTSAITTMME